MVATREVGEARSTSKEGGWQRYKLRERVLKRPHLERPIAKEVPCHEPNRRLNLERGDLRRLYLGTKALLEAAAAFGLRNAQEAEPKRWRFSQLVLIGIGAA